MGKLATATQNNQIQKNGTAMKLDQFIKDNWAHMAVLMPKHMNPERMMQIAISMLKRDPELAQCTVPTLLSALMTCSALGLEPSAVDGLGRAYILPFKNYKTQTTEATFILGYKGMIDLARRSGQLVSIIARAVFAGDDFQYSFGTDEHIHHVPTAIDRTPANLTHVYMVAKLKDGGQQIDVMTRAQIDASRQRSKSKDKGPWVTDFEPMACKTIIRRNFKYLPVSVELQSAVAHDETSGGYVSAVQTGYIDIDPIPAASDAPEHDYYPEVDEDPQAPVADAQRAVCKQCGAALEVAPDALEDDLRNVACKQCGALGLSLSVEGV